MNKKPASIPKQDENEDQVKLKPIMGIRPGVYLTVIYSLVLLAIFFILLVQPGLKNPRAALIVKTEPAGAAIRINDVYMGTSGSKIIVPKGTHTIKAVMPGFEDISAIHEIRGRVFGSLFFPRVYKIEFTLNTTDPAAAFALYAGDFAAWSFGGEPTETWQIPLSLSEGAYRVGKEQLTNNEELKKQLKKMLTAASRFADNRGALRDLIRAKMLLDNYGNAPSPAAVISSISDILIFLSENPGSAAWLSRLLPGNISSVISESEWANDEYDKPLEFFPDFEGPSIAARFQLSGLNFTGLNAGRIHNRGTANSHRPFGQNIYINSFLISNDSVPRSLFETFLNERPEWREHYTEYFHDEIAVRSDMYDRGIITGITWYAADAFCKWLTMRLPPSMANMEVRLPTEDEWEYASLHISNMRNVGWEWCADPYAPLHFITAADEGIQAVGSPERSLRGRTGTDIRELEPIVRRASLPPDLSSPFITFRPVIANR